MRPRPWLLVLGLAALVMFPLWVLMLALLFVALGVLGRKCLSARRGRNASGDADTLGINVTKNSVDEDRSRCNQRDGKNHVFFDFDQTISVVHVYKQLAGWEPGVPHPTAISERGQIRRLEELNTDGQWTYDVTKGTIVSDPEGGSWTSAALGGLGRVQDLRALLSELRGAGVKMTIITKGYVGAVRFLLSQEGLLDFFINVFGLVANAYGEYEYDKDCQSSPYEGTHENQLTTSKAELITKLMAQDQLSLDEAILVEDDLAEIQSVSGICRKVYVQARKGMTSIEMDTIRDMAGLTPNVDKDG